MRRNSPCMLCTPGDLSETLSSVHCFGQQDELTFLMWTPRGFEDILSEVLAKQARVGFVAVDLIRGIFVPRHDIIAEPCPTSHLVVVARPPTARRIISFGLCSFLLSVFRSRVTGASEGHHLGRIPSRRIKYITTSSPYHQLNLMIVRRSGQC